jgi:hypothetical protein
MLKMSTSPAKATCFLNRIQSNNTFEGHSKIPMMLGLTKNQNIGFISSLFEVNDTPGSQKREVNA